MSKAEEFKNPKYYDNRELSWIKFEHRVLNEAKDKEIPILDRLKFVSITSSNLDEFFMVRVASLKDMEHAGYTKKDIAGMDPTEQLCAIGKEVHALVEKQYNTYNRSLMPILRKEGIRIIGAYEELNEKQATYVDKYFMEHVYPVLTPMAVDASRPFPLVRNKSLNIAALIKSKHPNSKLQQGSKQELEFATVQVPSVLPRLVPIPGEDDRYTFTLLEQIIEKNMAQLFLNYDLVCAYPYRIMRNADLSFDEDEASDLLKEIQKQLVKRQWGEVIRLEIEHKADKRLLQVLKEQLAVSGKDVYEIAGPLDLTFLMKMYGLSGCDDLREKLFVPQKNPRILPGESIFDEIKKGDIFLTHPYETFDPVVDFIKQAAVDPDVLAIKQTLYRVSGNSPIIAALAKAAENGKQVTVLVELKARFDEENNIVWAQKLEKAGCHVIYGLVGLKTHCKIALVVRREEDAITRYVHLGTGNYNDSTAKLYTDCGIFTCNENYGEDATAVFNMLSGYSEPARWNKLVVAPIWLRDRFIALIDREIAHAKEGKEAYIVAKMNSLCDRQIIEKLYEASSVGVEIYLVIRGICCLRTGIPGVSEHIHVTSIVGTFLEHSRIFYFYNNGQEDIYMGSADWMPRNLDRRVEIVFPVEDDVIKDRIKHILDVLLRDNLKAYAMLSDGTYAKMSRRGKQAIGAQMTFCREAMEGAKEETTVWKGRRFIPIWAFDEEEHEA
ncbi:RNA degradosome polyphosphate kinase [Roseburia sp. AM51-8]|uniref:Polyphosphate kinase n=1 Tax=Roseburia lenta TaxID=2763061 RepID=A0ABR7GCU1_9FIRM|nr:MULTISPECIES: RNA degradosome polyphosphate kinase [Roseburia]MBC5685249.1 RNA degradosome polyphosphate kinase [Roseburia lenta]RHQ02405.1 RNA degradosome polyphosphate kinase [Roseburia sp. AM51-8]